jgi:hypothetical protein
MQKLRFTLLIMALCALVPTVGSGQIIPGKKPPTPIPTPRPPKPKVRTNGVLFLVTTPTLAKVIIKDAQGNAVKEGQSKKDGTFQIELRPGSYTIEVIADRYLAGTFVAEVERAKSVVIPAQLAPAFGSIVISLGSVGPDATILIDGQKPSRVTRGAENRLQIDDIPTGSHTLRITHPSIATHEEKIEVTGGAPTFVAPAFRVAMTSLLIRSEPGAEIYVDGMMAGKTSDKGELRIPDKKPGQHTIRAEKDKFEAAQKTDNFNIGDTVVEVKLNRIKSSPEFSDYFQAGASFWDAPKTWQVTRGKMLVKTSDVGFVRGQVWDDFKMEFDISFDNGRGASWIVRARDKKNYYLFHLSGAKGTNPRTFQSYIYQNGQPTLLKSDAVVEDLSRPKDQFHIIIDAKGSTIKHFIKLASNPSASSELLSTMTDSTLSYGTVGFGAIDGEEFVVYLVTVIPDESKSR